MYESCVVEDITTQSYLLNIPCLTQTNEEYIDTSFKNGTILDEELLKLYNRKPR